MANTQPSQSLFTPQHGHGFRSQLPPQDLPSEMAVIASVCLSHEAIHDVADLRADQFYADRHQKIWEALIALRDRGAALDAVTLAAELDARKLLAEIGGVEYLGQVLSSVPNAAHAKYYAEIVKDRWFQRQLVYGCTEVLESIYGGSDSDEIKQRVETVLGATVEASIVSRPVAVADVLVDAWQEIKSRLDSGQASGIPTGFTDLDNLLIGMQGGHMLVLGARPSQGKTAWALNVALQLAERGVGSLIISLEMTKLELVLRLVCSTCSLSNASSRLREGGPFDEAEIDTLQQTFSAVGQLPIYIDDSPKQRISEIASKARLMKRKYGIGILVVDYMQLVRPNQAHDVREQEVAEISKEFKALAKELDIPVLVLAQLNRAIEMREDKRPRLSDLRESGSLEMDADVVMFLNRPEVYDPNDRPGEADVSVAKNRHGAIGTVALSWSGGATRFRDLAAPYHQRYEAASKAFPTERRLPPEPETDVSWRTSGNSFGNRDR